jgi:hypothetical protein
VIASWWARAEELRRGRGRGYNSESAHIAAQLTDEGWPSHGSQCIADSRTVTTAAARIISQETNRKRPSVRASASRGRGGTVEAAAAALLSKALESFTEAVAEDAETACTVSGA